MNYILCSNPALTHSRVLPWLLLQLDPGCSVRLVIQSYFTVGNAAVSPPLMAEWSQGRPGINHFPQCVRDVGSIPGLGRPPEGRAWQPPPVFLLGESDGQRSLGGYSP